MGGGKLISLIDEILLDPSCIQDLGINKKEVHKTMKQILINCIHIVRVLKLKSMILPTLKKLETIMKLNQIFLKVNHCVNS